MSKLNLRQKEFLRLAVIELVKFDNIPKEMGAGFTRPMVSQWYAELKPEREKLAELKKVWLSKFDPNKTSFDEFHKRYEEIPKECHYCHIKPRELGQLFENNLIVAESGRGRKLEYERVKHDEEYDNLKNLVFACYWCNNAKTDSFTKDEFKPIGEEIGRILRSRLQQS